MADANTKSKIDAAAEKAYAEAAAKTADAEKVAKAVEADAPKPEASAKVVKKAVAKKAPAKKAAPKKAAAKKAAPKKAAAKKAAPKKTAAAKKPAKKAPAKVAAKKAAKTATNPVIKLKETIMATAEKTDFTAKAKEMAAEAQTRAKTAYNTAYAKAGEFAAEAGEFNKANLDAVVESGKIFFEGAQAIGRENVETGKTVVETVTADAKKMVAVKSPTELFQLQGELARRNFDAVVGFGSKRTEAWVKLYNDAFAPISNRVSVAAEKISKAA